jgi:hypothetical protein
MGNRVLRLVNRIFSRSKREQRTTEPETRSETQAQRPVLKVFSPAGNCAECRYRRPRPADADDAGRQNGEDICSIRGFEIHQPRNTYCKNFNAEDASPFGAVYSIPGEHGSPAAPWLDLAAPYAGQATCCICGEKSETGVRVKLPEDEVECCGPEHYLEWWTDYQIRRLDYFKKLGEKAYSDMYDVAPFSSATAPYSDAKEAFYSAISTARDLEWIEEQRALEQRLEHIKNVFRSQFR